MERQESKLKKTLGYWDLMGIAVGQIIGAGIMTSTGIAIGMTGTGVVLAYLLSPILTLATVYPVAVMCAAVPATGGQYRYVSRMLGKDVGMVYILLHITSNVTIASYALSFASYFVTMATGLNQHMVAMAVMTLFFITNLIGTKSAAIVNKLMTAALIIALALFIAFGLGKADMTYVFTPSNLFYAGIGPFISTLALLGSATGGGQAVAELGGETQNAGKVIPRVIVTATVGVGVIYVLIAIVAAGVLPIEQVADQPLTLVANVTMPKVAYYIFVIGGALGATATTLNASMSWITKPLLVACDDGLLPRWFGSVSKQGVPYKILTFFYIAGMLPLLMGFDLAFITKFTTANGLLVKILVCVAFFVFAKKKEDKMKQSILKISTFQARALAVVGVIVACTLSSSLLLNLSYQVIGFLAVLIAAVLIYSRTIIKNVKIEDDLGTDYTK